MDPSPQAGVGCVSGNFHRIQTKKDRLDSSPGLLCRKTGWWLQEKSSNPRTLTQSQHLDCFQAQNIGGQTDDSDLKPKVWISNPHKWPPVHWEFSLPLHSCIVNTLLFISLFISHLPKLMGSENSLKWLHWTFSPWASLAFQSESGHRICYWDGLDQILAAPLPIRVTLKIINFSSSNLCFLIYAMGLITVSTS